MLRGMVRANRRPDVMTKRLPLVLVTCGTLVLASTAQATPSTTVWAPSVATCQGFLIPHLTYDTYFRKTAGASYPVITGLTMGVLPMEKLNLGACREKVSTRARQIERET